MADDQMIAIDLDDLELGEVELFEEEMGQPLSEVDLASAKAIVRLIWIVKKRDDPKYTLEKARKVKLSQLAQEEGNGGPPTQAKPASKRGGGGPRRSGSPAA